MVCRLWPIVGRRCGLGVVVDVERGGKRSNDWGSVGDRRWSKRLCYWEWSWVEYKGTR